MQDIGGWFWALANIGYGIVGLYTPWRWLGILNIVIGMALAGTLFWKRLP